MLRKSLIPAAAAVVALLALPAAVGAEETCTTYGTGVALETVTPVAKIVAAPEAWEGKTVRVEGVVREVCPMAGCWLTFVPNPGTPELRVKVEDGEIVFPLSARGQRASAQGRVEVQEMTRKQYTSWRKHLAEEKGQAFDERSVGEGPYRQVQVTATGAEVCEEDEGA